jgi:hypothetical protein
MDPYLEQPRLWPDVHNGLIADLRNALGPALRPKYFVRLEERTYIASPEGLAFVGRPDLTVERRGGKAGRPAAGDAAAPHASGTVLVDVPVPDTVRETWLEVHAAATGKVVTVLELLSPTNKAAGAGRALYEEKRSSVLGTRTSLVEVDLVRSGEPMPVIGQAPRTHYRILVARGARRPRADLHAFSVRDPIPRFRLPLLAGDDEPEVDIGAVLQALYDKASYDLSLDYRADAVPPLEGDDAAWAEALLRERGLR